MSRDSRTVKATLAATAWIDPGKEGKHDGSEKIWSIPSETLLVGPDGKSSRSIHEKRRPTARDDLEKSSRS